MKNELFERKKKKEKKKGVKNGSIRLMRDDLITDLFYKTAHFNYVIKAKT